MNDSARVLRHKIQNRLFHWAMAISFLVLLITGLLPILGIEFNWVTPHWVAGLILLVTVVWHVIEVVRARHFRYMWLSGREIFVSAKQGFAVISGANTLAAKPGKYTTAQKTFHLAATIVVLVAVVSGVILMVGIDTPFWERDPYFVTEQTRGLVFVAHGLATLTGVTMIIVHVYFAARPEKRYFLRSMIYGWISAHDYTENHDPELWKEKSQ
jgi:cytochrome b subunit of formate dehydrogenase